MWQYLCNLKSDTQWTGAVYHKLVPATIRNTVNQFHQEKHFHPAEHTECKRLHSLAPAIWASTFNLKKYRTPSPRNYEIQDKVCFKMGHSILFFKTGDPVKYRMAAMGSLTPGRRATPWENNAAAKRDLSLVLDPMSLFLCH